MWSVIIFGIFIYFSLSKKDSNLIKDIENILNIKD